MTIRRIVVFLICIWITACGQSTISTPTATPPVDETPSPASTLPITFGPYLTPTRNIAPMIPPEVATDQAESTVRAQLRATATAQGAETATARAENNSDEDRATNTPTPTTTPTPTFIPAVEEVNFDIDLPYLQDGGALPPEALSRIGIGNIWYISQVNDQADILIGTSTGIYTYRRDTFERTWRRYLTRLPWGISTSPDGARTVSYFGWDSDPIMYNTEEGNRVAVLDGWHEAKWSPDSTKVAVEERPSMDLFFTDVDTFFGRINLYNGVDGELLRSLEVELSGFFGGVFSDIIWSPDSAQVAACGDNGIYIWNALNADLLHTIPADSTSGGLYLRFCGISFSPDGKYLAGVDSSNRFIFDLTTGNLSLQESGSFNQLSWIGEYILFTDSDGLTILDLDTLEETGETYDRTIKNIAVSPAEDRLALVNGGDIVVLDFPSLEMQYRVPLSVDYVYWSPGGEWVIGYDYDNDAHVFIDAASGEPQFPPLVPSGGLQFLDENTVIVVDGLNLLQLDLTTGEIINGVHYSIDAVKMGWTSEGQLLLLDSEETLWAWTEDTGELTQLQDDLPPTDTLKVIEVFDWRDYHKGNTLSPDERFLVTITEESGCGDGPMGGFCGTWSSEFTLTHFEQETEETVVTYENPGTGISTLGWSADSSMVALGEGGGKAEISSYEIIILDTQTGDELFRFEGHLDSINTLLFSPDGSRLASASSDGTVIIWNTAR